MGKPARLGGACSSNCAKHLEERRHEGLRLHRIGTHEELERRRIEDETLHDLWSDGEAG